MPHGKVGWDLLCGSRFARQGNDLSSLYPLYAIVVALFTAAAVPIAAPSLFFGAAPTLETGGLPRGAQVTIVSSGGAPPARVAAPAPPVARVSAESDDRWFRAQVSRMGATSVVRWPEAPQPAAAAPALVASAIADQAAQTTQAARGAPPPPRAGLGFANQRLSPSVPAAIRRWEPLILRYAKRHDLDPNLIAAVMQTESGGDPKAVSPANAIGLMQVLDGPEDPEENIAQGVEILSDNLKRFRTLDLALAAYNAGPGNVTKHGGVPPFPETYAHISRTMASYTAFKSL